MADTSFNLEDDAVPSFLCNSLDSTSNRTTLGNLTLGFGPGLPIAASTVAKIRVGADNRGDAVEASYLEGAQHHLANSQSSVGEQAKFALSFKDDMEGASRTQPLSGAAEKSSPESNGADSDHFSGSNSSFLANEKLMSVDSINSDITDDDSDLNNLPDDEFELYFNKMAPPAMQRGRVEGQEIPAAGLTRVSDNTSNLNCTEPEKYRQQFLDDYDQEDFQMPDVRLAATGMDSCPASDEDTEDELEAARGNNNATRTRHLLPSTSRQLVGESNRPSFRPGLEGGSSDDEPFSGRGGPSLSGIEHRRSAEGQVINPPVTGDGGGGDGSSGSEESGNDGGVSTIPLPPTAVQTTYDVLRGLGIVGSSGVGEDDDLNNLPGIGRNSLSRHTEMGDRVGPVGTGEALGGPARLSPVNWSMALDRQEALEEDEGLDEADGARPALGLRGGPCGDATAVDASDETSEDDNNPLSTSLEAKYFSQSFHQDQEDSDDGWNNCPDNLELEFQQGANATGGVVYQNEEGQWVTDLAYYSSFVKEVDGNAAAEYVGQLQTEDFVPACNAIEKIIEDQREFEKEHQFMQEEQIEAAGSTQALLESSWKLPSSSSILMRASQVSSEFERGNQSYLRLSLGQFFEQRSEALGCLGSGDVDGVKRPSFGYIITSPPEKRDPFPLIRHSDFSSRDVSFHSETIDQDKTLSPEDLDTTLDAPAERMSPKGDTDPEPCEKEDHTTPGMLPDHTGGSDCAPSPANQSGVCPHNNSNNLMLHSMTSAITNVSVSTDSALLDTLQRSACAGEQSAFDLEKYLRPANGSIGSDPSVAHTTFDMTAWGNNLIKNSQNRYPDEENGISAQPVEDHKQQKEGDRRGETTLKTSSSATDQSVSRSDATSLGNKVDSSRSSIAKTPLSSSARRSVGSGQSSTVKPPAESKAAAVATAKPVAGDGGAPAVTKACGSSSRTSTENRAKQGTLHPQVSNNTQSSIQASQKSDFHPAASPGCPTTSPGLREGWSGLPCLKGSSPPTQRVRSTGQQQHHRPRNPPETKPPPKSPVAAPPPHSVVEKHVGFSCQSSQPPGDCTFEIFKSCSEPCLIGMEETQCNFRPSTSPLIHSSPSADGTVSSPSSSGGVADRHPGCDLHRQSTCSSPSLSRLTYISINDSTVIPTPERQKGNRTMSLSTTIIRASPTPPMEPDAQSTLHILSPSRSLDQLQPHQSKSLDPLPPLPHQSNSPEPARSASALSCTRSQSESNYHSSANGTSDLPLGIRHHTNSSVRQLTKVDSGYSSNFNIQQTSSAVATQSSQQWGAAGSVPSQAYPVGGLCMPPFYSSEDLRYVAISSFKPHGAGLVDLPQQSLLSGHQLLSSQLAQQYLGSEAPLHPGAYHIGATGNALYTVSSSGISSGEPLARHLHPTSLPLGVPGPAGYHHLPRPHQNQLDMGMMGMGKPYNQHGVEPWVAGGLDELRGQVVVPEELQFPDACCVGIASHTSLSLFNPSDRWQQVSITASSLAIDGERVESLPYQWLIVKNKTIIGPKSTDEQKVLFIPPRAGVYQCVLSVSSWPASAESEVAARAQVLAKRVVLVAIAENPALEVEVGKSDCLDFGDLSGGSAKSLPLKVLNRTRATVPTRLVISANAMAWRCFNFSNHPVAMTSEVGHMTQVSSPSVMSHVLHPSYGETPESFMVWVHFKAPEKYSTSSGELGPADEYSARLDIEMDCPGPSHVIRSIPLRARSGTARVHAPQDLQTVSLSAPLGASSQQTLPLKNAGNIDVQLKLKITDAGDCFSVEPDEMALTAGEEQGIVVSFTAQGSRTLKESLLTILVLPSGPQYEVALKGTVTTEDCGRTTSTSAAMLGPGVTGHVPPILSNKQLVAWGGVTLGRAVQQKLVLRNNSPNTTQQLRLLIRGPDQDCFQLQSRFSVEERFTQHGELSIRPREDVEVHLLFAPTRVACMLAKLEIKQSGVRPSQPGVKFTIPLSGYGGTSNIILEDQRKETDGYVAILRGIAVGLVSKVCLCVRNTGSRAAFIKAMAFSDMQTRSIMEPSVISLTPSQFVLKERTREVITVLMNSTQREQVLCQSANALLATVCLFCGDEVSRQQYRRLLQRKPEAARKVLSENSLLKNIDFNEQFLGEEQITEAYDLPVRPSEAQIFYGNMSKVVVSLLGSAHSSDSAENIHVSLLGSTHSSDSAENIHIELLQPSARHASETDSDFMNGNVSLDVLPVKGPQGPALRVAEPSLKASEPSERQQESWTIHPDQLVLTAPTNDATTPTPRQVQISNNTPRELSFELSWPAHCLTIYPHHGVIESQCHLQILISPNPSLANKSGLLPWSGQIYVQCDGQQKIIKVQIRQDLVLDVSACPADWSLAALSPHAATPLHVVKPRTKPSQSPLLPHTPQAMVKISNKTILFPTASSGETSEAQLEVENGEEEVRWYLSSFAPPYVKGVDGTEDVYRATYTAFRCSRFSGTLGTREKMQVPITFLPRDRGDYAQFWDLECHPVSEPKHKISLRFQLCGTGVKTGPVEGPQDGDCSLVKTEATVKSRRRSDASAVKTCQAEPVRRRGVHAPQDLYTFPDTKVGESSTVKVYIRNSSSDQHELTFVKPKEPFHTKHSKYDLRSKNYMRLPVLFKPTTAGKHTGLLLIQSETSGSGSVVIHLTGEALP